ncbi:WXG100 family type VII secretion target [Singulisphaera rosea]
MGQAIVNPDDLRRFATQLQQFNNDLMGSMSALHGQLTGLGATWRDREHDKFVEEFEVTMKAVTHFVDATNEHIPFLRRKAERIEDYLNQR